MFGYGETAFKKWNKRPHELYIEANSSSSKKDFINFFTHSLKSANELKVWLCLLRDTDKGDKKELDWLLNELVEIANIIASGILTMKGKRWIF